MDLSQKRIKHNIVNYMPINLTFQSIAIPAIYVYPSLKYQYHNALPIFNREVLCNSTNAYYTAASHGPSERPWKPVTITDMKIWIGLLI